MSLRSLLPAQCWTDSRALLPALSDLLPECRAVPALSALLPECRALPALLPGCRTIAGSVRRLNVAKSSNRRFCHTVSRKFSIEAVVL